MKVLLTFTGFHDPFTQGLVDNEQQLGPVLTLVNTQQFEKVLLFSTPNTEEINAATKEAICLRYPNIKVQSRHVTLSDPTDYRTIINSLRLHFSEISSASEQYFIGLSSGTPQMHACWLLLAASGEIPARMLMTREQKHVTKDQPLIKEVDINLPEFPKIRSEFWAIEDGSYSGRSVSEAVSELGLVGDHPSMKEAFRRAAALASSDAPVLITGETGTGKELFARLIHLCSERAKKPFEVVNCASLPEHLVESILFGHRKGAFTGAISDLQGKFEKANNGTLFLDELGEMPPIIQAKLLRVLQNGIIEPLGAARSKEVNVRLLAATNKNLQKQIAQGLFREDLFYRLACAEIELPPLRERKSDIPKLALSIWDHLNAKQKKVRRLSQAALIQLQECAWQGNVRELAAVLESSMLLSQKDVIEPNDLIIRAPIQSSGALSELPDFVNGFNLEKYLSVLRKQLILKALKIAKDKQSEAARLLGVSPQAVHKFLKTEIEPSFKAF